MVSLYFEKPELGANPLEEQANISFSDHYSNPEKQISEMRWQTG